MKLTNFIKYFFFISGVGLLVGAFFAYQNTQEFIAKSVSAQGKVIELIKESSKDSDGYTTYSYHPLVEFETTEAEVIQFRSNVGSNPPSYRVNEGVKVLYLSDSPQNAKINSFVSLWLLPLILGGIGLVDAGIGLGMIIYERRKKKKIAWLQQFGRRVTTKFKSVEEDLALVQTTGRGINRIRREKFNYIILSQWSENGQVYLFKSEPMKFDPTEYLQKDQEVTVLVDPQDMGKYYMDVSFLPELKN